MRTMVYGLFVACVLTGEPLFNVAQAEWYVSGFGGMALPGSLSNPLVTKRFGRFGATSEARTTDIAMEDDLALGAKAGYFSQERKWLGLEMEYFTFTPNITQQPVIVGQPGRTAFGATIPGSRLRVHTWALNVVTRDTSTERFTPYGGLGLGIFSVESNDFPGKLMLSPGLNILAGANYFVTDHIALFGEWKFNITTFRFGGFTGDYSGQMFLGGVSYHFANPVAPRD